MRCMLCAVSLFVMSLSGCCFSNQALVVGAKAGWDVIGPRYVQYVNNDPRLANSPDIKADWLKTAEMLTETINRLQKNAEGK